MKICFICSEYPPGPHGGIGTLTQTLARGLVAAGHLVRVIGIYEADYPAPDVENDCGVDVWRFRESSGSMGWMRDRWRLFQTVRKWAREKTIDLVELPDWKGWAAGWPRLPIPVIVRLSGSVSYFASEMGKSVGRAVFFLENGSLHRADYWCSESHYVASKTRTVFKMHAEPDAIIYNPVELPGRSQEFRERVHNRVVFAGTLTAKKGILSAIQAWPEVKKACVDAELHIYGKELQAKEGPSFRVRLESHLDDVTRGSVRFYGHVPLSSLLEVFRSARVALFPSYAEGFALVPMHAMAAGCPTVYTVRGSGPELITSEQDGLLVDPDHPAQIAQAVVRLLRDEPLARRLGSAGRARIAQAFTLNALLQNNVEFYEECLARFQGSRVYDSRQRRSSRSVDSGVPV